MRFGSFLYRDSGAVSSCLSLCHLLQAALFYLYLADLEFLDFSGHRHGEFIDEPDVLRNFEESDLAVTKEADLLLGSSCAGFRSYPRQHQFAQSLIGNSHHLDLSDFGVCI